MANKKTVTVVKKPTAKVTNLTTPSRSGNNMTLSWAIPDAARNTSTRKYNQKIGKKKWEVTEITDPRFAWIDVEVYLVSNVGGQKLIEANKKNNWNVIGALTGNDKIWWRDMGNGWTKCTQPYNRSKYHPYVNGKFLKQVYATVHGGNSKGEGPIATTGKYQFYVPRIPSVGAVSIGSGNAISSKIDTDAGTDNYERVDTMYCLTRQDNFTAAYKNVGYLIKWTSTGATSVTPSYNMGDVQSLLVDQWIEVKFQAYARGIAGNSGTAVASHIFAHPAQAKITAITVQGQTGASLIRIACKTNASRLRPVDKCVLQRLKDTTAMTPIAASVQDGWAAVSGQEDDGNCQGFTDTVADAITLTDAAGNYTGNRTWYRVVTYHDNMPPQYSEPVQAEELYHPAPITPTTLAVVDITSAEPNADGTSVAVGLAWRSNDGSVSTEVSWSTDPNSWESTEQPETFEVTWGHETSDGYAATLDIRRLTPGQTIYVRARRIDADGNFGEYSSTVSVTSRERPGNVQMILPSFIARGEDLEVSWTFDGSEQKSWTLDQIDDNGNQTTLATGTDAAGVYVLPASRLDGMEQVRLRVGVSSGGGWAYSDAMGAVVTIVEKPTITIDVPQIMTAQPLSFVVNGSAQDLRLIAKVSSNGISRELPNGTKIQAAGDTIWSAVLEPQFTTDEDGYISAVVTLPGELSFIDGSVASVEVSATSLSTGLDSEIATAEVSVEYAHKAIAPADATAVIVDDAALSATITPIAPEGAAETDVFDLYRLTMDGAYQIATNLPFGTAVTDRYAPFGDDADLFYRVATRTIDGDVEWADFQYMLDRTEFVRLDWDGKWLEMNWGNSGNDSAAKDFSLGEKVDGLQAGYWNRGARREMAIDGSLIEPDVHDDSASLMDMARYAGSVFVRTSRGHAFEANVDMSANAFSLRSPVSAVSLKATEVALVTYIAETGDILLPDSEPEADDTTGEDSEVIEEEDA